MASVTADSVRRKSDIFQSFVGDGELMLCSRSATVTIVTYSATKKSLVRLH